MTDELPTTSPLEAALIERMTKMAAPLINNGEDMDGALYKCLCIAAQQLKEEGQNVAAIDEILTRGWAQFNQFPEGETADFSPRLHQKLLERFEQALNESPPRPVRLDEKKVNAETGFKMFIYPNESQHRGFPHVKVQLQDGDISVSLEEEPKVIAGKRDLRGEAEALRAVKEFREEIMSEWYALRPDDQRLR